MLFFPTITRKQMRLTWKVFQYVFFSFESLLINQFIIFHIVRQLSEKKYQPFDLVSRKLKNYSNPSSFLLIALCTRNKPQQTTKRVQLTTSNVSAMTANHLKRVMSERFVNCVSKQIKCQSNRWKLASKLLAIVSTSMKMSKSRGINI